MKIYKEIWNKKFQGEVEYPCFFLENNGWDDFDYVTLFQLYYAEKSYSARINLGKVKILTSLGKITFSYLDSSFSTLNDKFVSLGQSIDYYRKLNELEPSLKTFILEALNDVVVSDKYYSNKDAMSGYNTSLIRNSEARLLDINRKDISSAYEFDRSLNTTFNSDINQLIVFTTKLDGAEEEHIYEIDFRKMTELPHRVNVIVGKNGTGKTAILSKLAKSFVDYNNNKTNFNRQQDFSKVIAVSYSVFDDINEELDKFISEQPETIKEKEILNYVYCGLCLKDGIARDSDIKEKAMKSLKKIKEMNRFDSWKEIIKEILSENFEEQISQIESGEKFTISSGQYITVSIISEIVANIENNSLLLFDEPETHLHPNAISGLMRMICKILESFNSYCIISTHSPLIVQEIPSRSVRVFERYGNIPKVKKMNYESFGDEISNIIHKVFRVSSEESNYMSIFDELIKCRSTESIENLFENLLSINAKTYLLMNREEE